MNNVLLPFRLSRRLNIIFLANIFISLHYALIIYINSSFLSTYFSETQTSVLYILGAILDMAFLLNASKILEKLGSYKFASYTVYIELLSIFGMAISTTPFFVSVFFLIHVFIISLLLFNMDVFIEGCNLDESKTGEVRATYLTLTNICVVIAPIFIALLVTDSHYRPAYLLSCALVLPLIYLMHKLKDIKTTPMRHIKINETLLEYLKVRNLYNIFVSQTMLQLFYSFMVIYTPLYLEKYVGFSWGEIGIMFTIMLLPFVFFELPIGELVDGRYTEREFLTIGFIIMGLATIFMSFLTVKIFWMWTAVLFISRIGASFVEISNESYFFKQVDQEKTNVISFFRVSRPLSFIIAPILATISLQFIPFQYIFILIGATMIVGTHYSLALTYNK